MNSHYRKNNSQVDIRKILMRESQRKTDYISRILDKDIFFHMKTESNSPLKEKERYFRNDYNINNKIYLDSNSRMIRIDVPNSLYVPRTYRGENQNFLENNKDYYNKDNLNYSLNVNKPFHREKKHFPLINNIGNFFKIENSFLNKRKIINNFLNNQSQYNKSCRCRDYNKYNIINRQTFKSIINYNKNINKNKNMNLGRSNSMVNIQSNFPKINIKNEFIPNIKKYSNNNTKGGNQDKPYNSKNEKHYSPRRYDYEGSRFGDDTYNYLLNEPMRGDISSDWKFPPLYYYNTKIDYGKSFPDY